MPGFNCTWTENLQIQTGFKKGRGNRDQIANICWIIEKARECQKNIYFCFIDYATAFDCVKVKVRDAQSCPALCDLTGYSPWSSPGQNTGVSSCSLLQGIFPTQGSNPGLSHCRQILCRLSTREAKNTREGNLSLLQGIFPTQESNQGLLHCRWILYQLSLRESQQTVENS